MQNSLVVFVESYNYEVLLKTLKLFNYFDPQAIVFALRTTNFSFQNLYFLACSFEHICENLAIG